jgi:hypothetical protein
LCGEVRAEVGKVVLPMGREELKLKLNEIENKFYLKLEGQFVEVEGFKHYLREFLRMIQKMNRDVKRSNQQMCREKTIRELRDFVK